MPEVTEGLRTLGFSSSVSLAAVAVEVLRRPKSSDGRVRLAVGVGLFPSPLVHVADAGSRGGGMSPCLEGCAAGSSGFCIGLRACGFCDACVAALEGALRQPLKLSLRRNEEPDDGVSGSVEVEVCAESDVSFFCNGRAPAGFMLCISTSLAPVWYSPLGLACRRVNSPLPFGNEFEEKGVVVCRVGFSVGMGIVPIAGGPPNGSAARRLYAELLLRICFSKSWFSWGPLFAKKLAFDAVMGVLGVLFTVRFGGGVTTRSSTSADGAGNEDMRLLNGAPNGSRFNGGSLMGWRFFLAECCATGVLSVSEPAPTVRPRLCLIDPVLPFDKSPLRDSLPDVSVSRPSLLTGGADGVG